MIKFLFIALGLFLSCAATLDLGTSTNTLPSGEPKLCAGDVPLTGCVFFADSIAGVDTLARDGRTLATAWNTPQFAENNATGAKHICLMDGSVWNNTATGLAPSSSGIDANNKRRIGGCYFNETTNDIRWYWGGDGNGRGDKPELRGPYDETCSNNALCNIDVNDQFIGHLLMDSAHDNIVFTDFVIRYARGRSVSIEDALNSENLVFDGVDIYHSGSTAFFAFNAPDIIWRNSIVDQVAMCEVYQESGCTFDGNDGGNVRNWPSGIYFIQSPRALFENNMVTRVWGEGVTFWNTTFGTARGNVLGEIRRPTLYINNASETVFENNILFADPSNRNTIDGSAGMSTFRGLIVGIEDFSFGSGNRDSDNNILRNNILVGVPISTLQEGGSAQGFNIGFKAIGNTIIGDGVSVGSTAQIAADGITFENNLIEGTGESAASICVNGKGGAVTFISNLWGVNPSDSTCDDGADVIGAPTLSTAPATTLAKDGTAPPASTDVESSGLGTGAATDESATVALDADDYPNFQNFVGCRPSELDWEKLSATDFNCDAVSGDIGALADP